MLVAVAQGHMKHIGMSAGMRRHFARTSVVLGKWLNVAIVAIRADVAIIPEVVTARVQEALVILRSVIAVVVLATS